MATATTKTGRRRAWRMVVLGVLLATGAAASVPAAEIAGDPRDRPYVSIVLNQALETERTRVDIPWTNPETGTRGVLTINRTWYKEPGTPCRDYVRTIRTAGGARSTVRGSGCRIGPAVWTLTETLEGKPPRATTAPPRQLERPRASVPPPASSVPEPPPEPATATPPPEVSPSAPAPAASEPPAADANPASTETAGPDAPPAEAPVLPEFTVPSKAEM